MPAFEYEAVDGKGLVRTGVITADTARLARRELRQNKLVALKLSAVSQTTASGPLSWLRTRRRGVGAASLMLVTRQLATMVSAAAPLEEAVQTIALQTDDKTMRTALLSIRTAIMEGLRLSDAMAQHPHIFNGLYRALVAAGELSGNLGGVLERLADHLERAERLRSQVVTALIYPLVLAVVAVLVITILMTFVVPKVIDQFATLDQELPLLTRLLIGVSDGLGTAGLPLLALLMAGALGFRHALKSSPAFRRRVDAALLALPLIGTVLRNLQAARLCRTLGTLIASGSPVVEGLAAAQATVHNVVLQEAVGRTVTAIREGASLSHALRRAQLFPPMIIYMSAVGENTGKLDDMLGRAADHLEREFERFAATTIGLLEPAIIVVMGGVVAAIVLAILMPILQLNTLALL
jgi:general secretion pathway protein F